MSHLVREFQKLLYQKRTYFGWAGLFIVPFLVTLAIRFQSHQQRGGGGGANQQAGEFFFEFVRSNGLFVALATLFVLMTFLLPLLASLAGSQTVASEAEKGTLRTVLMQPTRRGSLLLAKWFVANVYVAIGLIALLVGALIAGGAFFGLKPLVLPGGSATSVGHSIWLIFVGYVFCLVALASVVSLTVALSTLTDSGIVAMGAGLGLVIVMIVLGAIPQFAFLQPYLFTSHFGAWFNFFSSPIAWGPIRDALINFAIWIVGMTGIAYIIFRRKDILS